MRGEASPHETITVIVPPVSRGVDSICRLKKVVDTVDWVNLVGGGGGYKRKDGRKENQKGKSVFMTKAIQASDIFSR